MMWSQDGHLSWHLGGRGVMYGVFQMRPGAEFLSVADNHLEDQHGVLDRLDGISALQKVIGEGLDGLFVRGGNVSEYRENQAVAQAGVDGVCCVLDVLALVGLPRCGHFFECDRCHDA